MLASLWTFRRFIWVNALADLRHRFSGSVVGYLWNVFVPLAQIAVFAVIFSALMGYSVEPTKVAHGSFTFVVFLCSGLLPWNAFAETFIRNSGSLVGHAGYLRKLPMPEQVFVAKETATGMLQMLLSLGLFVLFALVLARSGWHWPWLQAVPMLALFMGFAFGLGMIFSCVHVFFRDVQPLLNVLVLLWMWLTPVVYFEEIFNNASHQWVLKLIQFNPAYHYISGFQTALYKGDWISPSRWMICLGLTISVNLLAIPVLRKLRGEIRDVL